MHTLTHNIRIYAYVYIHIYIYVPSNTLYISPSSSHAVSTDLPDPLSQPISIIHRSRELLHIGFRLSSCFCSSMSRGPQEYI